MTGPTAVPGQMPAQVWYPPAGRGPGVLLLHEIFGVTDYVKGRARDLADLGYVVMVPRIYWRIGQGPFEEATIQGLQQASAAMQTLDWDAAVADACDAFTLLASMPQVEGRPGILGFCFGGGLAYATASALQGRGEDPSVLVSYYGSALPMLVDSVPVVRAPSLHHFGDADTFIDAATQAHIREVVTATGSGDWHTWQGAGHAFDNPSPLFHHEHASARAWQVTCDWLAVHLPVPDPR